MLNTVDINDPKIQKEKEALIKRGADIETVEAIIKVLVEKTHTVDEIACILKEVKLQEK